ncbi:hypothetical protein EYF80_005887 [Liparis tanakae]|uniref:Uncharacterized protein n=1 Tax=Liparis tanakae TaxID=230148 RepID=A0A4Z2J1F5_9TELE|nr:hypothetical protein EYF80_005887 [Liparis tanakae]
MAEVGSDVGDLYTLVGVQRAAFGPGSNLNSGLSGQRTTAAVEAQTSLHGVVPMQHVFVAGDPQGFGHGVCVKGRIQSHHCSMNPFTLKIICKLLEQTGLVELVTDVEESLQVSAAQRVQHSPVHQARVYMGIPMTTSSQAWTAPALQSDMHVFRVSSACWRRSSCSSPSDELCCVRLSESGLILHGLNRGDRKRVFVISYSWVQAIRQHYGRYAFSQTKIS